MARLKHGKVQRPLRPGQAADKHVQSGPEEPPATSSLSTQPRRCIIEEGGTPIRQTGSLRALYATIGVAILLVAILTPFLAEGTTIVREEYAEVTLLVILLSAGYVARALYLREAERARSQIAHLENGRRTLEDRLDEALRYIGRLNVQVQEIEGIFTSISKYPETRNEKRKALRFLAEKILNVVDNEWVLVRIVDRERIRTLGEHWATRVQKAAPPSISNSELVERRTAHAYTVVESSQDSFSINTYCVLPGPVTRGHRIIIEAIANQAEMLFLIFSSRYYKDQGAPPEDS